jgi:AsmA family
LRDTLAWLDVDVSGVPAGKLRTLTASGKMTSPAGGGVQIGDAVFELDETRATGSATVNLNIPFTSAFRVELDRFDLDAYMPRLATEPALPLISTVPTKTLASISKPAASPPVASLAPSFSLKAKVAKLRYRGDILSGIEGDVSVQGNLLKLNDVKVADLLGAKLGLKGQVKDFGTMPNFDLTFNCTVPDADRLLDYAGLPKFLNGKIGAATASGGLSGTMAEVSLRDVTVGFLGVSGHATGKLILSDLVGFDFQDFQLQTQDLSRLISVATGRTMSGVGQLSVAGGFKGSAQRAVFTGELDVLGVKMSGALDATLGKRPKIAATLKVPGTLDVDRWLGVSESAAPPAPPATVAVPTGQVPVAKAAAVTAKPIDLSALRSFDAKLALSTSALSVASVKIDYADIDATLNGGIFKIGKLTGQFYGGAVDVAGTIDAAGQALALELKGDVNGIYLGQMLRGTAGTNNFGNSDLTVAIDGKVNATGIQITGKGKSAEEIRNAMNGGAVLSGYLYPAVVKGSHSFARFATGVGSMFSDEMAFASLMLDGFIDRQNSMTGRLQLIGNAVTTEDHTVQGQNATARIVSQTSLAAATTDTTVSISGGGRNYVVTIKGPLAAPVMSTPRPQGK